MNWEVPVMTCRKSYLNGALIRSCLERFWPVWAGNLFIRILMLPVPLLRIHSVEAAADFVWEIAGIGGMIVNFLAAAVTAICVFGWMYGSGSAGFHSALPLKRGTHFLSSWLGGLLALVLPAAASAVLGWVAALAAGVAAGLPIGGYLAVQILQALIFFGLASLCAMLTGAAWVLPCVYAVFGVVAIGFWAVIGDVTELLLSGFGAELPEAVIRLSPPARFLMIEWADERAAVIPELLLYGLAGLLLSFFALLLFRRRRMETAGDTVALEVLKPVFRWCAALASGLLLTLLLVEFLPEPDRPDPVAVCAFLLLGGLIGWLAAEMLVRKSYRVLRILKRFPIFAAVVIAYTAVCATGCFGYSAFVPKAEAVARASYEWRGYAETLEDPASIETLLGVHRGILAEPMHAGSAVCIRYELTDGRTVTRRYDWERVTAEAEKTLDILTDRQENLDFAAELAAVPELAYVDANRVGADGERWDRKLTDSECARLRACMLQDIAEGALFRVTNRYAFEEEEGCTYYYMDIEYSRGSDFCWQYFSVTAAAPRTFAFLESLPAESPEPEAWER